MLLQARACKLIVQRDVPLRDGHMKKLPSKFYRAGLRAWARKEMLRSTVLVELSRGVKKSLLVFSK